MTLINLVKVTSPQGKLGRAENWLQSIGYAMDKSVIAGESSTIIVDNKEHTYRYSNGKEQFDLLVDSDQLNSLQELLSAMKG